MKAASKRGSVQRLPRPTRLGEPIQTGRWPAPSPRQSFDARYRSQSHPFDADKETRRWCPPGHPTMSKTVPSTSSATSRTEPIVRPDGRPRNARRCLASVRARFPGSAARRSGSGCENDSRAAGSSGSARHLAGGSACASPSGPAPARRRAGPGYRGAGDHRTPCTYPRERTSSYSSTRIDRGQANWRRRSSQIRSSSPQSLELLGNDV